MKLRPLLLIGSMLAVSGCTVHARTIPASATIDMYEPLYYDGYTVYYDDFGAPFYYVNGRTRFVPRTYVGFNVLVDHYNHHRPGYRRWYQREGNRHIHVRRHAPRPNYHHRDRPPRVHHRRR